MINIEPVTIARLEDSNTDRSGSGIASTISMSKMIKIIPKRKNRREKGIRAEFLGSKPHSKGEIFSRSLIVRELRIQAAENVAPLSTHAVTKKINEIVISQE